MLILIQITELWNYIFQVLIKAQNTTFMRLTQKINLVIFVPINVNLVPNGFPVQKNKE